MHGLDGLQINQDDVDAPGHTGVRDYMLAYMGQILSVMRSVQRWGI